MKHKLSLKRVLCSIAALTLVLNAMQLGFTIAAGSTFTPVTFEAEKYATADVTKDATGVTCIATGQANGYNLMQDGSETLPKGNVYKVVFYVKLLSVSKPDTTKPVLAYNGYGAAFDDSRKIYLKDFKGPSDSAPVIGQYVAIERKIDLSTATTDLAVSSTLYFANDSSMSVKVDKIRVMLDSEPTPDPVQDTAEFTSVTFEAEGYATADVTKDATGVTCIATGEASGYYLMQGGSATLPRGAVYKAIFYVKLLSVENSIPSNRFLLITGTEPHGMTHGRFISMILKARRIPHLLSVNTLRLRKGLI